MCCSSRSKRPSVMDYLIKTSYHNISDLMFDPLRSPAQRTSSSSKTFKCSALIPEPEGLTEGCRRTEVESAGVCLSDGESLRDAVKR